MIPFKLVETLFHRWWALVIPVLLVPALALALRPIPHEFQSTATVWVTSPVADSGTAIGSYNPYLSVAQNQQATMTDLLATDAFRGRVAIVSGIVGATDSPDEVLKAANELQVSVWASGVNLVTVSAVSKSASESQAIAQAVIDQYLERATAEIQSNARVSLEYYTEQLNLSQQSQVQKDAELSEYLLTHPKATDPSSSASRELAYLTLVDQAKVQAALVASLQASLHAVQLRAASAPDTQGSQFAVQDSPSLPSDPLPVSTTSKVGIPIAAMFLGLLIGFAYVYFSYRTDHTIRSGEDLTSVGVPLLGSVPQLQAAPRYVRYTPVGWFMSWRQRDFARKTARGISTAHETRQIEVAG